MANIKAADGAYMLNGEQFNYTKDNLGRPVLNVKGGGQGGGEGDFKADGSAPMTGNLQMNGNAIIGVKSISNTDTGIAIESDVDINNHKISSLLDPVDEQDAATKKYVDEHSVLGTDGKIDSELDMNEHAIVNVHKIATNGPAPLYIGPTVESEETNAPRLTGATDGSAAFVKASTQNEYVPVSVGVPTATSHATNKEYVDGKVGAVQASALLKSGGTMIGKLKLTADPTDDNDAVTKKYVDDNAGSGGGNYLSIGTNMLQSTDTVTIQSMSPTAKTPLVVSVLPGVNVNPAVAVLGNVCIQGALVLGGNTDSTKNYMLSQGVSGDIGFLLAKGNNADATQSISLTEAGTANKILTLRVNDGSATVRTDSTDVVIGGDNITLARKTYDTDGITVTSTSGVVVKGIADPTDDTCAVNYGTLKAFLPDFTEADNGKVLGVVNGALAWVDK